MKLIPSHLKECKQHQQMQSTVFFKIFKNMGLRCSKHFFSIQLIDANIKKITFESMQFDSIHV